MSKPAQHAERMFKWPLLAAVALLLLVCLTIFYWPFLSGRGSFYLFDFTFGWQPYLQFISQQLSRQRFPAWNPYADCGVPQIAFMAPSPFYPANWLFTLMRFSQAMSVNIVVNQLCAGLGAFLLVESLGLGLWCALSAGLIYPLTGLEFSLQSTYSLQAILGWFPLSLWSIHRLGAPSASNRLRGIWFAASCLFVYLLVSAGMPEMSALCLSVIGIFVLATKVQTMSWRQAVPAACLQLFALLSGTLLCAPQILPLLEWSRLSPRGSGLSLSEVMGWSANWYDLCGLFLPQPLGDLFDVSNPYRALVLREPQPYIASIFVGPTVLTAAAWGVADRRFRPRYWLVAMALAAIILGMGSNSEMAIAFVQTAGIKFVRYPIKLFCFLSIAICFCAARGIHTDNRQDRTAANRLMALLWMAVVLAGTLVGAAALGAFGNSQFLYDCLSAPFLPGNPPDRIFQASVLMAGYACLAGMLGLFTCLLLHLQNKGRLSAHSFSSLVIFLATGQLITFAFQFHRHAGPADFYTRPLWLAQQIRKLEGDFVPIRLTRICTIYQYINGPRNVIDKGHITESDYEYDRQMLVPPSAMDASLGSTLYFTLGETQEHYLVKGFALQQHHASNDLPLSIYCRSTSTQFVLTQARLVSPAALLTKPIPALDSRYFKPLLENLDWNLRIYATNNCLPRIYFARSSKWGYPHSAVIDRVRDCDQSHFDPHALTILEHNFEDEKVMPIDVSQEDLAASWIRLVRDEPERIDLNVFTPKSNYLVLCDEFYPGWQASVDGKPSPIFRANAFLRAVLIPQGRHSLIFVFRPASLITGLWLAALALVMQASLVIWLRVRP